MHQYLNVYTVIVLHMFYALDLWHVLLTSIYTAFRPDRHIMLHEVTSKTWRDVLRITKHSMQHEVMKWNYLKHAHKYLYSPTLVALELQVATYACFHHGSRLGSRLRSQLSDLI